MIKLWPHQARALQSPSRFVGLIGGTGGGKTFFGPLWLYQEMDEWPEDEYFVVAPTYKMLTRATAPALIEAFRGTRAEGEYKQSMGLYQTPQGTKVWLGSADRPETLEAGQYRAAWLDEAGQMKYMAWVAIQGRLGLKKGRALLTTTPYGMNWLYHHFYKPWQRGEKEYDVVNFLSTDNPLYPAEEYERARRDLSPELFDMRYRGLFRKLEGLVFADFSPSNVCEPFEIPGSWPRFGGTDFGYNNPHVNLKGALSQDDILYVYAELYVTQTLLKDIAPAMMDMAYTGDPAGLREIKELRGYDVDISSGSNDKGLCRDFVNARVRTDRLKIFNTVFHTLDEIETYHFKPGTDKPEKIDDHCMEALMQMCFAVDHTRHKKKGRVHHAGKKAEEKPRLTEDDKLKLIKLHVERSRKPHDFEEDVKPEAEPEQPKESGGYHGRKKGRVYYRGR